MHKYILLFAALLSGCANSTSRTLPVGFDQAEPKLRELYPSILVAKPAALETLNKTAGPTAKFSGPLVTVRRNEMTNGLEQIVIDEFDQTRTRFTEITLKADRHGDGCTVSVAASKSKREVFFPSRDTAFEQAMLNDISAAVK